ncbi:uncharacterized protein [Ciconia boyciana]|uniref:uncharacterized protein isoform X2 n=1 Tax=Ciconia boyciana TaxID=52775 RepID=UPI003BA33F94
MRGSRAAAPTFGRRAAAARAGRAPPRMRGPRGAVPTLGRRASAEGRCGGTGNKRWTKRLRKRTCFQKDTAAFCQSLLKKQRRCKPLAWQCCQGPEKSTTAKYMNFFEQTQMQLARQPQVFPIPRGPQVFSPPKMCKGAAQQQLWFSCYLQYCCAVLWSGGGGREKSTSLQLQEPSWELMPAPSPWTARPAALAPLRARPKASSCRSCLENWCTRPPHGLCDPPACPRPPCCGGTSPAPSGPS